MQNLFPQMIQFNVPFIFTILIAVTAAAVTVFYYRRTNPEVSNAGKYALGVLRGSIIFLIILLFFAPRFLLQIRKVEKPKIAVFADNSLSMSNSESDSTRWDDEQAIVKRLENQLNSVGNVSLYVFNDQVIPVNQSDLTLSKAGTDFSQVLDEIKKNHFDKAVIISDGNHTESNYPLPDSWPYDTNIFTIGISKTGSENDLSIPTADFSPVSYFGKKTEIRANIKSFGITDNERIKVNLQTGNKIISSKYISTGSGEHTQSVLFEYLPAKIGLNTYTIEIEPLPNELNKRNNRFTFVQNTLKNKIRVGIIGSQPQYETKFLNFILDGLEDFENYTFIEKPKNGFFGAPDHRLLDSLDVIILCGFPGKQTPGNFNDKILQLLKTGNVSLIFYLNEYTDIQKITNYLDFLPFDRTPARSGQQDILVNPPGELNTASQLILFDNPELGRQFWAKIPPLSVYTPNLHLKSGSKTILQGKYNNINVPFIVLHEDKRLRMVLFNGQGFWKWHFYFQNNPELIPGYSALIQNMLRWTTDKTKLKPVMLETQRHLGYLGETISLKGFLFDGQYNPIKDGSMVVEATWNDQKFEIEAKSDSSGSFNIQFIPPGEGHYTLVASGYREGIKIGEDQVAMEIIPLEKEFIKTTQNADFLKKLARLGNGKYFDAAEIDSLVPSLAINNKIVIDDRTIEIWYNPVLLTLIIILITAEWITRKRLGLV